jgi:GxxExxY protein
MSCNLFRTFEPRSGQIIAAAIEVHTLLGPGYREKYYERALSRELRLRGIPHERQYGITVTYKEEILGKHRLDVVVPEELVVEIKAARAINEDHAAQVRSYLKSSNLRVGLILNFGRAIIEIKRVVN